MPGSRSHPPRAEHRYRRDLRDRGSSVGLAMGRPHLRCGYYEIAQDHSSRSRATKGAAAPHPGRATAAPPPWSMLVALLGLGRCADVSGAPERSPANRSPTITNDHRIGSRRVPRGPALAGRGGGESSGAGLDRKRTSSPRARQCETLAMCTLPTMKTRGTVVEQDSRG